MKRKDIGCRHTMPVQPTYIIGTYNEDGTADFAPITWVSHTYVDDEEPWIVISMWGTKKTKRNVQRTGQFDRNAAACRLFRLVLRQKRRKKCTAVHIQQRIGCSRTHTGRKSVGLRV